MRAHIIPSSEDTTEPAFAHFRCFLQSMAISALAVFYALFTFKR